MSRGPRNAPATLQHRSSNAPGRCNFCFWGHAALLQRSRTLQPLLLGLRNAPAWLLDAATATHKSIEIESDRSATQRDAHTTTRAHTTPNYKLGLFNLDPASTQHVGPNILECKNADEEAAEFASGA